MRRCCTSSESPGNTGGPGCRLRWRLREKMPAGGGMLGNRKASSDSCCAAAFLSGGRGLKQVGHPRAWPSGTYARGEGPKSRGRVRTRADKPAGSAWGGEVCSCCAAGGARASAWKDLVGWEDSSQEETDGPNCLQCRQPDARRELVSSGPPPQAVPRSSRLPQCPEVTAHASPKALSWPFPHSLSDLIMPMAHQSQIFVSSSDLSLLCTRPLDISP